MTDLDGIIAENIEMGNYESSSDEIICPYCGYTQTIDYEMYFGDNDIDIYTEGEQDVVCPECNYTFKLNKELTWSYTTEVIQKS